MKKISVIIPCFNAAGVVRHAWESLRSQTIGIEALECIFIDDASKDEDRTWETLLSIEREAPDSVMVIRHEDNMRQGGARNTGLDYATGEYIMFLDADDAIRNDACATLYKLAKEYDTDLITFHFQEINPDDPEEKIFYENGNVYRNFLEPGKNRQLRTSFLLRKMCGQGCWDKFYRREMVKRSGARYPEHLVFEEPMFVYPMFAYADRVLMIPEKFYLYSRELNITSKSFGVHLLEHPRVQLMLQEYLTERKDIYDEYLAEFDYHFIYSFYMETLLFSYHSRYRIPLDFFRGMQDACKTLCPGYRENPYLKAESDMWPFVESITYKMDTQQELEELIMKLGRKYNGINRQGEAVDETG